VATPGPFFAMTTCLWTSVTAAIHLEKSDRLKRSPKERLFSDENKFSVFSL
jgi:hypothetical protein